MKRPAFHLTIVEGTPVDIPRDMILFHTKFGLEYDGPPRSLPIDMQVFRSKFLQEELDEYNEAIVENDLGKALDSLVDLMVVAAGTAYLHGFPLAEAWARVQTANMAKVRAENAEASKRGSAYDVVKPAGWTPPVMDDLVSDIRLGETTNVIHIDDQAHHELEVKVFGEPGVGVTKFEPQAKTKDEIINHFEMENNNLLLQVENLEKQIVNMKAKRLKGLKEQLIWSKETGRPLVFTAEASETLLGAL